MCFVDEVPDTNEALSRRIPLCHEPTPLEPMDVLADHLGLTKGSLWVKRDDMTGLALGGNKARKLEYLCYEALEAGADVLVTGGGSQSNHCRMTAAAANRLGLDCLLLLEGSQPKEPTGNILLYSVLGARVIWLGEPDHSADLNEEISAQGNRLRSEGRSPYVISVGGSVPVGALGYLRAVKELLEQDPDFDLLILATGSCGTHAGVVAGLGDFERVLGVRVGERKDLEERVTDLAVRTAALAGLPEPKGSCRIDHEQLGDGYGAVTKSALEAIELAARTEGLILDPVYTGKAMAGLISAVRSGTIGRSTKTIFLHTGGSPGLFASKYKDSWDVP
jgi:D-cysteine desulfhydrase family pyridoxal phosphate-dependent enzyme